MVFAVAAAFAAGWFTGAMPGTKPTHPKNGGNPCHIRLLGDFEKLYIFILYDAYERITGILHLRWT
jgi:hypothetical protein